MKINTSNKSGFTLVEIMIVVAIIGLLAALAVPSFVKARKQSQGRRIINDARQWDAAIDQWALETGATNGQAITVTFDPDGNVAEKKGLELDEFFTYDDLKAVFESADARKAEKEAEALTRAALRWWSPSPRRSGLRSTTSRRPWRGRNATARPATMARKKVNRTARMPIQKAVWKA